MFKQILTTTTMAIALAMGFAVPSAPAALILGSNVDSQVFHNSIAQNTEGWTYLGPSLLETSPLGLRGQLTVKGRSSTAQNTFGYADMDYQNGVQVIGADAGIGTIFELAASMDQRLFYFETNDADIALGSDDNRQYSGGSATGEEPGIFQGGIDILYHANSKTWAFFFDEGGGGIPVLGDDNDYDDLIVTFRAHGVPEPGAVGLMSLALFGLAGGILRRRKQGALARV